MSNPNKQKRTSEEKAGLALAGSLGVESLSTGRAVQVLRGKKLKPLPIIGDKGEVALQAANLGVGAYAASKLLRQKAKDNGAVMKNDQSMISKASGDVSGSGHGKGLGASLAEHGRQRAAADDAFRSTKSGGRLNIALGATSGGVVGGFVGSELHRNRRFKSKKAAVGAGIGAASMGGLSALENSVSRHNTAYRRGIEKSLVDVSKAYRRFDPEADRQRRAGIYTGAGVAGAALAGREASNHFTTRAVVGQKKARGIVTKPGKGRLGLGLAALSGASGAFAANSYKNGLSARNQPWT